MLIHSALIQSAFLYEDYAVRLYSDSIYVGTLFNKVAQIRLFQAKLFWNEFNDLEFDYVSIDDFFIKEDKREAMFKLRDFDSELCDAIDKSECNKDDKDFLIASISALELKTVYEFNMYIGKSKDKDIGGGNCLDMLMCMKCGCVYDTIPSNCLICGSRHNNFVYVREL